MEWITQNTKECPKCHFRIEKNDGCDHMTCIKCHYEFCWSCRADFDLIRKNGNHRHDSNCKHYAAYNESHNCVLVTLKWQNGSNRDCVETPAPLDVISPRRTTKSFTDSLEQPLLLKDPRKAVYRCKEHRCRYVRRGILTAPVNGPSFCLIEYRG
ncbi:hypothetical protein I4U23_020190 [Adineta vaga]|nr:hypothetical protein I4U23_020190 [Adineta vaga]